MKMGRERAVLRWDIHASLLTEQIAKSEKALTALGQGRGGAHASQNAERRRKLEQELVALRGEMAALGPSPRAKMG